MSAPKKRTVTLTAAQALYLVDVGISAASTDRVTPVICAAFFTVSEGLVRVFATDRYRCHTAVEKALHATAGFEFLLGLDDLRLLRANIAKFKGTRSQISKATVTFESIPGVEGERDTIVVKVSNERQDAPTSLTYSTLTVKGKYPPVVRLFDEARDAEAGTTAPVKLDFLAKSRVLAKPGFPEPEMKFTGNEGLKPGPLLLTFKLRGQEAYAEAIIQPMLRGDS